MCLAYGSSLAHLTAGRGPPRGFPPYAVFPDRFLALLAAAVLPGTGREPLLHLGLDAGPDGYDVRLDDGTVVGHLGQFDEALLDGMNAAVALVRSPLALSLVLEAAGAVALERCGAILAERAAGRTMAGGARFPRRSCATRLS